MSAKEDTQQQELLEKLRVIRKKTDLKPLPLTPFLKTEVLGLDGELHPFSFRYYQIIGILNMLSLRRMVLGDSTGTGKTIQTIGTLCYLWEKKPETKVLVFAPKSAIRQWAGEIERFTNGIRVFLPPTTGGVEARQKVYEEWLAADKGVLILNYALLVRDWNHGCYRPLLPNGRPDPKQPVTPGLFDSITMKASKDLTVIFDEAAAFKSMQTKTWEMVRYLSDRANRVYGLTATLLKNNLMEGYSIYKAIVPSLFSTKNKFYEDYCYIEYQRVGKGAKIPIVKGYKNLDKFREVIELVFLGRQKHEISSELPTLTTREVSFELDKAEELKYREALAGVLELGDGDVREFEDTKALTSLIYCQQVVNSMSLLKFKEGDEVGEWDSPEGHKIKTLSSKEQALVDLLTEELDEEKVIVYTRFESHVARLQEILKKQKIKSVRITGKEDDEARRASQQAFQDLKSDTRVVFITAAGSEAINLQAAAGLVFYDMPWSWGDYVQILGRMIRIGSPHINVLCFHLLAQRPGSKKSETDTIDHHVLSMLKKKKNLIDKVLGEAAVGALKFEKGGSSLKELVQAMQGAAGKAAKKETT